jgi:dedicator of cytokinesis protein 3
MKNQVGTRAETRQYQTRFTGLAERVLGLCLSSHDQMCETAVEILFSMIHAEYVLNGKFNSIETEIFAKLDKLVCPLRCDHRHCILADNCQFTQRSNSTSDPAMRAYFVAQLRAVFEASPQIDTQFHSKVGTFLDEVELFIDLLVAVRDLPDSAEWRDERAAATYRLMDFIKRIGRTELYIRFTHQLVQGFAENREWLAAGLALKLHADLYAWELEGDVLDVFENGAVSLPAQSQFARKESLYYLVLDYLGESAATLSIILILIRSGGGIRNCTRGVPRVDTAASDHHLQSLALVRPLDASG